MAPSPTIRRLLKETAELSSPSSNPNPAFFAAPVSEADLHEWHFTLLGPPSPSPYAGGLYHGRITLPTTYPLKPPNFRFLNSSGRFEVNREICLSISGFHEETWMPAWGVRTALTALRSFMAEPGTAGQVGGLEASKEVRMRLAKESRGWRCEACKKSNEAIMREWWDICQEAGVNVQEEDLGLDALPEGMKVEARDPKATQKQPREETVAPRENSLKTDPTTDTVRPIPGGTMLPPPVQQASSNTRPQQPPQITTTSNNSRPHSHTRNASSTSARALRASIPIVSTPTAEATQASAESFLTSSELASRGNTPDHHRITNLHSTPVAAAAANATINATNAANSSANTLTGTTTSRSAIEAAAQPLQLLQNRDRDRQRENQSLTIDRAIAGVFLALCLMVLKKIFYPAGPGGAGRDDFYLQRE